MMNSGWDLILQREFEFHNVGVTRSQGPFFSILALNSVKGYTPSGQREILGWYFDVSTLVRYRICEWLITN